MRLTTIVATLLAPNLAFANPPAHIKPVPTDAQCQPLPAVEKPRLPANEFLYYDIDVLAANAARMEVETLPKRDGVVPIRVRIKTNTFFNKVRRVTAEAKSYLNPRTMRPSRYTEDSWENDLHKVADVSFRPNAEKPQTVRIRFATNPNAKSKMIEQYGHYAHDALDEVGAIYYLRSIDLKPGLSVCFDVYAMRRIFRVWGKVGAVEKVSTAAGEFNAFHITGTAARLDVPSFQRELHVWISADDRRIPLGALGGIDLGPVRATLTHIGQPGDEGPVSHAEGLDW